MKEKKKIILVSLAFFVLFLILTNLPYEPKGFVANRTFETHSDLFFNYEIIRYPSRVEVSEVISSQEKLTLGVVVDPWNLNFGIIPAGKNFATRFIDLANLREKDAKVSFKVYGNISPLVNFTKNDFILKPNESATIEVKFYAESAKIGNYSGEIDVIVQRPKYEFLYVLWK